MRGKYSKPKKKPVSSPYPALPMMLLP